MAAHALWQKYIQPVYYMQFPLMCNVQKHAILFGNLALSSIPSSAAVVIHIRATSVTEQSKAVTLL